MQNFEVIELINKAHQFTYTEYRNLLEQLQSQGLTTGENQSPEILEYARLNNQRMSRLDKMLELLPETLDAVRDLNRPLKWVVLTEGWCGDAAQNVPALAKIAQASGGKIDLILLLRDENLKLIDLYLTNGGRSIPKLICFDAETGEELGKWGPRPAEAQHLFLSLKNDPAISQQEFLQAVHQWYAQDKCQKLQMEITALLRSWQL